MDKTVKLHQFNVWANEKVFEQLKKLPLEIYRKETKSVFPSVTAVLLHMYQVDYVWLKAMSGEDFYEILAELGQVTEDLKAASIEEIEEKFKELSQKYDSFIQNIEDLYVGTTVHHPHFGTLHSNYADLIQHVVNHGTYHRGHISAILNQLGHKGASIDYVFYLYSLQHQ
ncbi:DinB family protein [Fictibacillus phosphorivorans]|uniref:DinB family protein n=1 Tax=Fictibacillus phosphorivorans TaxID=1221500 RepID=UPI002042437B|nr:DinB family protein [Fictibacillus phosphorivorans]MCM3718231.1 DinB family protein [Fictibacillus phosphorivorans]MCM3775902.1 DinB family protein [Fictibacillus phosphorivorans]